jgi:hypothetical protein
VFPSFRVPRIHPVIVGPYDLVQRELPTAVVPAGEADVVGIILIGDFDEVTGDAGEQCVGGDVEVEAAVVVEAGGDGVEDVVRRGAAAAEDDYLRMIPHTTQKCSKQRLVHNTTMKANQLTSGLSGTFFWNGLANSITRKPPFLGHRWISTFQPLRGARRRQFYSRL